MLKYLKGAYFHEYLSIQHVFPIRRMRISYMLSHRIFAKNDELSKINKDY